MTRALGFELAKIAPLRAAHGEAVRDAAGDGHRRRGEAIASVTLLGETTRSGIALSPSTFETVTVVVRPAESTTGIGMSGAGAVGDDVERAAARRARSSGSPRTRCRRCRWCRAGVPPKTLTSARAPVAHCRLLGPVKVIVSGTVKKPGLGARGLRDDEGGAPEGARAEVGDLEHGGLVRARPAARGCARARAPAWSVSPSCWSRATSGRPGGEVMKRKSPETTSKRTPRAGSGMPPCESVADDDRVAAGAHRRRAVAALVSRRRDR